MNNTAVLKAQLRNSMLHDHIVMMGVDADNIWTAGDNYNDLLMLRRYHGCAMASGVQAAKDASEFICRDIAEVVELAMKQ